MTTEAYSKNNSRAWRVMYTVYLTPYTAVTGSFITNSTRRKAWRRIGSFQHGQAQHYLRKWHYMKVLHVKLNLINKFFTMLPLNGDAWIIQ